MLVVRNAVAVCLDVALVVDTAPSRNVGMLREIFTGATAPVRTLLVPGFVYSIQTSSSSAASELLVFRAASSSLRCFFFFRLSTCLDSIPKELSSSYPVVPFVYAEGANVDVAAL